MVLPLMYKVTIELCHNTVGVGHFFVMPGTHLNALIKICKYIKFVADKNSR